MSPAISSARRGRAGRQCVLGGGQGLLGFCQQVVSLVLPPGFQGAGRTRRFFLPVRPCWRPLGPVSLVAGPFNCQPGCPALTRFMLGPRLPAADKAKCDCSGGRAPAQQRARPTASSTQAAATFRQGAGPARSRVNSALIAGPGRCGSCHHRLAATSADDYALAERDAPRRELARRRLLAASLASFWPKSQPGDVARVMSFIHKPTLGGGGAVPRWWWHRPRPGPTCGGKCTPQAYAPGIGRILQHSQDTGVGELAPPPPAGPSSALSASGTSCRRGLDDSYRLIRSYERGEHVGNGGPGLRHRGRSPVVTGSPPGRRGKPTAACAAARRVRRRRVWPLAAAQRIHPRPQRFRMPCRPSQRW